MDFLTAFRNYLFSQKPTPSKATVKNYTADLRRFINWYETRFKQAFSPHEITGLIIAEFRRDQSADGSSRSVERYLSTLRKFFSFLIVTEVISTSPFEMINEAERQKREIDPLKLRAFKDFLYTQKAADLTIKNYIIDLQQFFHWLNLAAGENSHFDLKQRSLFTKITPFTLEEYKRRLTEAGISGSTINRKLSSLRRYILWAREQSYLSSFKEETLPTNVPLKDKEKTTPPAKPIELTLPTGAIETPTETKAQAEVNAEMTHALSEEETTFEAESVKRPARRYSSFPPLRLGQRLVRGGLIIFDTIIVLPVSLGVERASYLAWRAKGSQVFVTSKQAGIITKVGKVLARNELLQRPVKPEPKLIASLPKSFYAPLSLSLSTAPLHRKAFYHLRHTRPTWYRKYHSYAVTNYVHVAILVICMSAGGFGIAHAITDSGNSPRVSFQNMADAPPRVLAFRGRLTRADNTPITADTDLRFGLYDDAQASGSALLWQEIQHVHPTADGSFSVLLGSKLQIPQHLFTDNSRLYIGMTVEDQPELTPRRQIPTTAYAANTDAVQGLKPITDPDAGVKNTLLALDSSGNLTIGGKANPVFQATGGSLTLSGNLTILTTAIGTNTDIVLNPDGFGEIDLQKGIHNTSENISSMGIPGAVAIDDTVAISSSESGRSALYINQNANGPLISASVSGIAKFTLDASGSATFGGNLMLYGNSLSTSETSFNLLSTNPINLNFGNSATAISIGSTNGVLSLNNAETAVQGKLTVKGKDGISLTGEDAGFTFSGSGTHLLSASQGSLGFGAATLTGNVTVNTGVSIIPEKTDGTNNLGSPGNPFGTLYVNNIVSPSLSNLTSSIASFSADLTMSKTNSQINILNGSSLTIATSAGGDTGLHPSLTVAPSGNVGIGANNTNPQATLDVSNGSVFAQSFVNASSRRFKEDITPISDPLGMIGQLQGVYYNWNAEHGGKRDVGFIAEDVGRVLPEVVTYDADGINAQGLDYGKITALAIEGIKAEQDEITQVKSLVDQIAFLNDRNMHIIVLSGQYQLQDENNQPVAAQGAFQKAFIATLETGLTAAKTLTTDTLTAGNGVFQTLTAHNLQSDYMNLNYLAVADTITGQVGTLASLYTDTIHSTQQNPEFSLELGRTDWNFYRLDEQGKTQVARIDNQGNASFTGAVTSPKITTVSLNAETASVSGILTAQKVVAQELDLSDAGLAKLLSQLNLPPTKDNQTISKAINSDQNPELQSTPAEQPVASVAALPLDLTTPTASASSQATPLVPQESPTTEYDDMASQSATLSEVSPNLPNKDHTSNTTNSTPQTPTVLASSNSGAGVVLPDVSIAGMLTVQGNMVVNDDAIDVVGADLAIQPLRQGGVNFLAGLVAIDTDGNLTVSGNATFARNLTVKGRLAANIISPIDTGDLSVQLGSSSARPSNSSFVIKNASGETQLAVNQTGDVSSAGQGSFSTLLSKSLTIIRGEQADASPVQTIASASAGMATIEPGQIERTIVTPFVTNKSLIYLTPVSDTQGVVPYIARQTITDPKKGTAASFTIRIPQPVAKVIKVNWWIVN